MSIVNLAKARAYADWIDGDGDETAAEWIQALADEVESLTRTVAELRATAKELQDERDQALAGLRELYEQIGAMLREARLIVDHHPDPAASAAAMRIMREDKS